MNQSRAQPDRSGLTEGGKLNTGQFHKLPRVLTDRTASRHGQPARKDQIELKELANTATRLKGYIIQVTCYAESTGNDAMNTELNEDRAKAVVTYLMQKGEVPVRHIVTPGALGEYGSAAPNETAAGRAANRRVEVKVLLNKGIAGS